MTRPLKKEELKVGMEVKVSQLESIYNTYILLSDTDMVMDDNGLLSEIGGKIQFIGTEQNNEFWDIKNKYKCMIVFNTFYEGMNSYE